MRRYWVFWSCSYEERLRTICPAYFRDEYRATYREPNIGFRVAG